MKKYKPQTLVLRDVQKPSVHNEHNNALFLTSSFTYKNSSEGSKLFLGELDGYTYSRTANPNVDAFANLVAKLEGAEAAQATSTGMAAITSTFLSLLKNKDHVVVSKNLFGTTLGFIDTLINYGIEVTYVDLTNLEEWQKSIRDNTKMFFLETPSNPLCQTVDLIKLSKIAHDKNIIVVIDNTFNSPAITQPLKFGIDLVVHSATKALDGHGRVFGGVVCGPREFINKIHTHVKVSGEVLSPFNAWVLLNGIETLFIRMEKQSSNALELANFLEGHSKVEQVFYPGLKSHPQYDLLKKQQNMSGIVIAFKIKGSRDEAWKLIDNTKLFSRTGNLGDVKSTITHPYTTTHCRVADKTKQELGITENLIRVSIGIEHIDDLKQDLKNVLELI